MSEPAGELGKIHAGTYSYGHPQCSGNGENQSRAGDGICHSTARFAHRVWELCEKVPVERSRTAINQIAEDSDEGKEHDKGGETDQQRSYVVSRPPAPCIPGTIAHVPSPARHG